MATEIEQARERELEVMRLHIREPKDPERARRIGMVASPINARLRERHGADFVPVTSGSMNQVWTAREDAHATVQGVLDKKVDEAVEKNSLRVKQHKIERSLVDVHHAAEILDDAARAARALPSGGEELAESLTRQARDHHKEARAQLREAMKLKEWADDAEGAGTYDHLPQYVQRMVTEEERLRVEYRAYDPRPFKAVVPPGASSVQKAMAEKRAEADNATLRDSYEAVDHFRKEAGMEPLPADRWKRAGTPEELHRRVAENWSEAARHMREKGTSARQVEKYESMAADHVKKADRLATKAEEEPSERPKFDGDGAAPAPVPSFTPPKPKYG